MKLLDGLRASALGALTLLSLSGVILIIQVSGALLREQQSLDVALTGVSTMFFQASNTVKIVGNTFTAFQPSAVKVPKLIDDARLSLDNINKAAMDERFYFEKALPPMMVDAHDAIANVQKATADLPPLIQSATARMDGLQPIEVSANGILVDADKTLLNPDIARSIANVNAASADLAITSREAAATGASVQQIAAEGQKQVHDILHPKPLVSIANWTLKIVHALNPF